MQRVCRDRRLGRLNPPASRPVLAHRPYGVGVYDIRHALERPLVRMGARVRARANLRCRKGVEPQRHPVNVV